MKYFYILTVVALLVSCGKVAPKGDIVSEDIQLEEFVNLNLEGKFRLFYVKSNENFVNVETYGNVADNLKIKVQNKTLNISEKRPTEGVDFYNITVYSKYGLQKISISDSVEMNVSSEIKTDKFRLNLKNNGKFIGSVNSRRAEVEMADTSLANFIGTTKEAVLKISDTANIIAPYWQIEVMDLTAKNGTYSEIHIKDSLKGSVENTAKLLYYNDPVSAIKIGDNTKVNNKKLD